MHYEDTKKVVMIVLRCTSILHFTSDFYALMFCRYYICFGASCALLVVLICLTFGLLCGCCGSRPSSGYQDDCCNKGAGSRYLMLLVLNFFILIFCILKIYYLFCFHKYCTKKQLFY